MPDTSVGLHRLHAVSLSFQENDDDDDDNDDDDDDDDDEKYTTTFKTRSTVLF